MKLQTWPKMLGLDLQAKNWPSLPVPLGLHPRIDCRQLQYIGECSAQSRRHREPQLQSLVSWLQPRLSPGCRLSHYSFRNLKDTPWQQMKKTRVRLWETSLSPLLFQSVAEIPPISMETKPNQHQILCKTLSPSISLGLKMSFFFHH